MDRKIIIRTEASSLTGIGHLRRCLSLALALREAGAKPIFAISKQTMEFGANVLKNFQTQMFPECHEENTETLEMCNANDIVIADSYNLNINWEKKFEKTKLVVIDDLNREHHASLILDQNFHSNYSEFYSKANTEKLLGPKYALLDSSYAQIRDKQKPYLQREKKLLISFGGSAQKDLVQSICKCLQKPLPNGWKSIIIVGTSLVKDIEYNNKEISLIAELPSLSKSLSDVQLALGAGGTTSWERCCLGVPSLTVSIADNQILINQELAKSGYVDYLGELKNLDFEQLPNLLANIVNNQDRRLEMSKKCADLVDGLGAQRVASKILAL